MGFIADSIRRAAGIKGPKANSLHTESEEAQEDAVAILLIAAAIAAGLVEVVEDGVSNLIHKK